MLQGTPEAQRKAREFRKAMSLPEVLLWQRLKTRPNGLKFRPQHPAGKYVLDFYCHEARLIVEIDGIVHEMGDRPQRDAERDAAFAAKGFRIVRISAADVLRDPIGVAESILRSCRTAPPPSALRAATSPDGEGPKRSLAS